MTRVWSLPSDEEPQSQSLLTFYNQLKLFHQTDSGYESSFHCFSSGDEQDFQESARNASNVEDSDGYLNLESNGRVASSPIPIPRSRAKDDKYKRALRHRNQSSLSASPIYSSSMDHSFSSLSLSASFQQSNTIAGIGHPPCICGCIRGYRYRYLHSYLNSFHAFRLNSDHMMSQTLSSNNYLTENLIHPQRSSYPLPDIVSSSLLQNSSSMNEMIREIGTDLRRISKDFITARNQKMQTNKDYVITGLIGISISVLKKVIQFFK